MLSAREKLHNFEKPENTFIKWININERSQVPTYKNAKPHVSQRHFTCGLRDFCTYYNIENKMKFAVNPDKDLPIGPLCPAAFTIPEFHYPLLSVISCFKNLLF